jgi:hypothetical protein
MYKTPMKKLNQIEVNEKALHIQGLKKLKLMLPQTMCRLNAIPIKILTLQIMKNKFKFL